MSESETNFLSESFGCFQPNKIKNFDPHIWILPKRHLENILVRVAFPFAISIGEIFQEIRALDGLSLMHEDDARSDNLSTFFYQA